MNPLDALLAHPVELGLIALAALAVVLPYIREFFGSRIANRATDAAISNFSSLGRMADAATSAEATARLRMMNARGVAGENEGPRSAPVRLTADRDGKVNGSVITCPWCDTGFKVEPR